MPQPPRSGRKRAAPTFAGLALLCSVVAGTFSLAAVRGVLVLVGTETMIPMVWVALPVALVALLLAGAARLAWQKPGTASARAVQLPRSQLTTLTAAVLGVAAAGSALVGAAQQGTSIATLLEPPNGNGCRVVVTESSFLLSGSITAYAFAPGPISFSGPRESVMLDDGGEPFASGNGTMRWTSEQTAQLSAPGMLATHLRVTCP